MVQRVGPYDRRSVRLQGYDYAQEGAYFITLCCADRACLFGTVVDGEVRLNATGRIVAEEWVKTPILRSEIALDEWVVMPNHLHAIVLIAALVAGFKSSVTKRVNALHDTPGATVWQRNYHEHIVRNEASLHHIRRYIIDNPARWNANP